jgi:hypothetical protein
MSTSPASRFRTTRLTRGRVRELKNAPNSVTVYNRTHVYMNFLIANTRKSPPAVMSTSRETACMYCTVVTIFTAQWSLYVLHSGHYMHCTVVTISTAQ